jgi:uncharacterized protein involved in exopolysaccharide biosynthesis
MEDLDPLAMINKIFRWWWVLAVAIFLGGLVGYVFSNLHTPIYEATARFYVTLDVSKYGDREITDSDKDMALSSTTAVLISDEVLNKIVKESQATNLNIDLATLISNDYTLERDHAFWYLRYRSNNPLTAQKFVNLWAQTGYQTMLEWQSKNLLVDYVKFSPPTLAQLPSAPIEYNRNFLMLSGALLGFIAGIFITNLLFHRISQ